MNDAPPVIPKDAPRKSPRSVVWLLFSAALVVAVASYLLDSSQRPPQSTDVQSVGPVAVSVRVFETNAFTEEVSTVIAISNEGPDILEFGYGTQIRVAAGWADTNGNPNQMMTRMEDDATLKPGSERLVHVEVPSFAGVWRVFAVCWRLAERDIKDKHIEAFYSPEMGQ